MLRGNLRPTSVAGMRVKVFVVRWWELSFMKCSKTVLEIISRTLDAPHAWWLSAFNIDSSFLSPLPPGVTDSRSLLPRPTDPPYCLKCYIPRIKRRAWTAAQSAKRARTHTHTHTQFTVQDWKPLLEGFEKIKQNAIKPLQKALNAPQNNCSRFRKVHPRFGANNDRRRSGRLPL